MLGADYSWGRPSTAALKNAGVRFVGRYAAAGRIGINISRAEADALRAADLNLYIFNEHQAGYMMGGRAAGAQAATGALAVTRDAGLPDGVVYFSADFQAQIGHMPTIGAFLAGAATSIGQGNVGIYGSHDVVAWVLDHTPVTHAVQCAAWSDGQWDPRAEIRQDRYGMTLGGAAIDGNTLVRDGGQFRLTKFPPPITPRSSSNVGAGVIGALQTAVHATVDGIYGPDTDRRLEAVRVLRTTLARSHPDLVRAAQPICGLSGAQVDGIWGVNTAVAWTRCVEAIQRALGVQADGLWGPATDAAYLAVSPAR
jgi:hypothetical protein